MRSAGKRVGSYDWFYFCFSLVEKVARGFAKARRLRKELSKMPREAVSSAVSSRVRQSFGEKFASRGREENI